jgi:hypothetical protein
MALCDALESLLKERVGVKGQPAGASVNCIQDMIGTDNYLHTSRDSPLRQSTVSSISLKNPCCQTIRLQSLYSDISFLI